MEAFVDIHCHLIPGIDDGAETIEHTLDMARTAVADGIGTIIVTPHQLGSSSVRGELIRERTRQLQQILHEHTVPLHIEPGADVRIEPNLASRIQSGDVLTLADKRKHVLLELPHELSIPLGPLLKELRINKMVGILSHPERNLELLVDHKLAYRVVEEGGLLQITADSLLGTFGSKVQRFAEQLVAQGWAHFIATDAHGTKSRPPILSKAFQRVVELADQEIARDLFVRNPAQVAKGLDVAGGRRSCQVASSGRVRLKPDLRRRWFGLGNLNRAG